MKHAKLPDCYPPFVRCPFCSGHYTLTENPLPMAVHSTPYCAAFAAAGDALEFAIKAREACEKQKVTS